MIVSSSVSAARVHHFHSLSWLRAHPAEQHCRGSWLGWNYPCNKSWEREGKGTRVAIPVTPATNFWLKSTFAFLSDPFWLALSAVCQVFNVKKTDFRKQGHHLHEFRLFNPCSHPNSDTYEKMSSSQEEIIQSLSHHHNISWGRSTITRCQILKIYQLHQCRHNLNSWTSSASQESDLSFNRVFSSCISTRFVEGRILLELNWKLNQYLITRHCIKTVTLFLHITELLVAF